MNENWVKCVRIPPQIGFYLVFNTITQKMEKKKTYFNKSDTKCVCKAISGLPGWATTKLYDKLEKFIVQ